MSSENIELKIKCWSCNNFYSIGENHICQRFRPSMEEICMDVAKLISKRSVCKTPQRHIGCVITNSTYTKILSWGYNGTAAGDTNECDYSEVETNLSRCSCVHAEMNALVKLSSSPGEKLHMFVTLFPCPVCAKLIVNVGQIDTVFYLDDYRNNEGARIFNTAGIKVVKLYGTS